MTFSKNLIIGKKVLTNGDDVLTAKFYTFASVHGLDGNDTFETSENGGLITSSEFFGGAGNDRLIWDENTFLLGNSKYDGGSGIDTLELTSDRRIVMSSAGDAANPSVTVKTYLGWLQTGSLTGESVERYIVNASDQSDVLVGGSGDDFLNGRGGLDTFQGSLGDDAYVFDTVGEKVVGETANGGTRDQIFTTVSVDLRDNANVEILRLEGGNINGIGSDANNIITGSAGDNSIAGGLGNDQLSGKGGADVFVFAEFGAANRDSILDFDNNDKIQLDSSVFTGLTKNGATLDASDFVVGTTTTDTDATILYNSATGVLSYDVDGAGAGVAQEIAAIGRGLTFFDASDILIA